MKTKFNSQILQWICGALLFFSLGVTAQPYGQMTYNHNNVFMSSAIKTTINSSGFLMTGYSPFVGAGMSNFYIDKTTTGGAMLTPGTFAKEYTLFWSTNGSCSAGPQTTMSECLGVSIIETNLTSPARWYALAGVMGNGGTDYGMFFATLDGSGVPVDQEFYKFPTGSTNPSQPIITEYNGSFVIAGSYELSGVGYMYILRLTPGVSAPVWSDLFSWNNTGSYILPKDLVYSTISPNTCIVVVGISNNGLNTTGDQGFLSMHFANSGGAPNDFLTVGHGNNNGVDQFHSIKLMPNSAGGSQFIVGGYTDVNAADATRWLLFGDGQFNIQFSKIYSLGSDITGTIVDVDYRYSSTYLANEFYALATSPSGMMVLKTTTLGVPFSSTVGPGNYNNAFVYNTMPAPAKMAYPVSITNVNTSGADEGLQMFASQDKTTGDGFYMVESYFNGESDCVVPNQVLSQNLAESPLSSLKASTIPPRTSGLTACQNFNIGVKIAAPNFNPLCGGSPFVPSGDNSRVASGLKEQTNGTSVQCFMTEFSLQITSDNTIDVVKVMDQLGRIVWEQKQVSSSEPGKLSINTSAWASGLYYVQVTSYGQSATKKVMK